MRAVFGIIAFAIIAAFIWLVPWRTLIDAGAAEGDRPPWVAADGTRYPGATFPELYKIINAKERAADGSFRVPDFSDEHDYLANAQFGSRLVYRCIATRLLEDHTPAGTLGWCTPHG